MLSWAEGPARLGSRPATIHFLNMFDKIAILVACAYCAFAPPQHLAKSCPDKYTRCLMRLAGLFGLISDFVSVYIARNRDTLTGLPYRALHNTMIATGGVVIGLSIAMLLSYYFKHNVIKNCI